MLYLGIFIFVLNSCLGLITITKRRDGEGLIFGIFAIAFGVWALGIYATLLSESLFWGRLSFAGAILGIGSLLLFSIVFPGNKSITSLRKILLILPTLILVIASSTDLMIKSVDVHGSSITGTFGPLMSLYQIYAPIYIVSSIYIIIRKYKKVHSPLQKKQVLYAIWGMSLFVLPAVITNAILPLWFNIYSLNSVGPLFSICMVGLISYAIVKHQFLDIKFIVQRGLIYSILLSFITGFYIVTLFTFEYLFHAADEKSFLLTSLITTVIGIMGVPPLKLYFQKVTDTFFFKDTYDYALVLNNLSEVLNKNIVLDTIIEKTSAILKESLKIQWVTFTSQAKIKASQQEAALIIPITSNKKNIGSLYLGPKLSGDPYTKEDMGLLDTFAKQAGTAIEKASLYKQVKEYAKTLEEKVADRTKEITKIQKDQESMILEISHGLQTPLTIMKGELFFLKKQNVDLEKINTLDMSIDRISSFINRLLSLSRLEGTTRDSWVKVDLSDLTRNLLNFFSQTTDRLGISLISLIEDNVSVCGSKEEIDELISNLLSNAIKYIGTKDKKEIKLTLSKKEDNALIILQDTGVGIKEEDLGKLFEKFVRIKSEATRGITGTGLGLAVCEKIVSKHGGTIGAKSVYGEGSTFEVTLPLSKN